MEVPQPVVLHYSSLPTNVAIPLPFEQQLLCRGPSLPPLTPASLPLSEDTSSSSLSSSSSSSLPSSSINNINNTLLLASFLPASSDLSSPPSPSSSSSTSSSSASSSTTAASSSSSPAAAAAVVALPSSECFVDITPYLNLPQSTAAKKLNIPTSTLSKRWREAVRNRKWPYRIINKLDKEITTLLHNIPQGPGAPPIPEDVQEALGALLRRRQDELRPVVIRVAP